MALGYHTSNRTTWGCLMKKSNFPRNVHQIHQQYQVRYIYLLSVILCDRTEIQREIVPQNNNDIYVPCIPFLSLFYVVGCGGGQGCGNTID